MFIAITGRETELARAELESIFSTITILNRNVVSIDTEDISSAHFEHIGFTKKIAKVIKSENQKDTLAQNIATAIYENSHSESEGKLSFGISWLCDQPANKKNYINLAKQVKKHIQTEGRSARFIQPKDGYELNAAQLHYNKLLTKGCEIILFGSASNPSIAITTWVFNPNSYSRRDYDRPARSAKVGMFPPKLAQNLINLARPNQTDVVCDPFCGSGVVLQEALYAGYDVVGSDNSIEMVHAAQENLDWFKKEFRIKQTFSLKQMDARDFTAPQQSYVVVSEGYLGPALSKKPNLAILEPIKVNLERLYISFLTHLTELENKPQSVVITIPFWRSTTGINYLKVIDQISDLGYTIRQFNSVDSSQLLYIRNEQIVGRQVMVLELKKS